jgi:hypothetical protein
MKDTVLVNYNTAQINKDNLVYQTSLNPALGMNSLFVGGTRESAQGDLNFANECVQTPATGGSPCWLSPPPCMVTAANASTVFSS